MKFEIPYHKEEKEKLVSLLLADKMSFDELMSQYIINDINERFGWALTSVIEKNPLLGEPWIKELIKKLEETNADDTRRNITRSLHFLDIPEDCVSELVDICYRIVGSAEEKTAARVFAMSIIYNQVIKYPDLGRELIDTLTVLFPMGSAGFQSRARKIIKSLSKK